MNGVFKSILAILNPDPCNVLEKSYSLGHPKEYQMTLFRWELFDYENLLLSSPSLKYMYRMRKSLRNFFLSFLSPIIRIYHGSSISPINIVYISLYYIRSTFPRIPYYGFWLGIAFLISLFFPFKLNFPRKIEIHIASHRIKIMYNNPVYENEWIKRSVLIDKGIC